MTKRQMQSRHCDLRAFDCLTQGKGTVADFDALRRDSLRLHRWYELECGDGRGCIERDDTTGRCYWQSALNRARYRVPDRETGAKQRIAARCASLGLHHYIQTDPRGWSLYVSDEPLTDSNYNRGLAIGGRL